MPLMTLLQKDYRISPNNSPDNYSFLKVKYMEIVVAIILLLCSLRQLLKGGNYSREEIINGNTVCDIESLDFLNQIIPFQLSQCKLVNPFQNPRKSMLCPLFGILLAPIQTCDD